MTRSEAKLECKGTMARRIRLADAPGCSSCTHNRATLGMLGCADCVLIAEEWTKLKERLESVLRKEIANYQVRRSEGGA